MPIFNLMASTDMGLLDTAEAKLRGLLGYIEANTPRSTRPVAKPSTVINEGLLNPNKYNAVAANRFKDAALGLGGIIPGAGDYASGVQAADLFNRGENFAGGVAALGALPIIPAIGGMFIGKGAKTWDAIKAQQAEEMLAKGVDPREVWKQTGTMRGVDKALRQEIPDNAAKLTDRGYEALIGENGDNLMRMNEGLSHPALADAYGMNEGLMFANSDSMGSAAGNYADNLVTINRDNNQPVSTGLHELQHAIQQREGWARGGSPEGMRQILGNGEMTGLYSPEELHEGYRRLAGEAEARLTQSRMNMNMDERLASYPMDMMDVPPEQQIVRGLLDGPAMSYADEAAQKGGGLLGVGDKSPDFGAWGVKTGKPENYDGGSIKIPFIDDAGEEYGSIVYKETPTEIIIDGLGRNRMDRAHKGAPSRAVKAIIDKAMSEGKTVRATAAGFAKNYWGGPMGFKVDPLTDQVSPDYIFDSDQAAKVLSGDVNSTIWGHERGYGKMFEDIYGPSIKKK